MMPSDAQLVLPHLSRLEVLALQHAFGDAVSVREPEPFGDAYQDLGTVTVILLLLGVPIAQGIGNALAVRRTTVTKRYRYVGSDGTVEEGEIVINAVDPSSPVVTTSGPQLDALLRRAEQDQP